MGVESLVKEIVERLSKEGIYIRSNHLCYLIPRWKYEEVHEILNKER